MTIQLNTDERVFQIVRQGFGSKQVFCNLKQIPMVLKQEFEVNDQYKVYQFWNTKPKAVSKKFLNEMFAANQVQAKLSTIVSIDIQAREYFHKSAGNTYFSCRVVVDAGRKTEKLILIPFEYGYDNSYQDSVFRALKEAKLIPADIDMSLSRYCRENAINLFYNKEVGYTEKQVKEFAK